MLRHAGTSGRFGTYFKICLAGLSAILTLPLLLLLLFGNADGGQEQRKNNSYSFAESYNAYINNTISNAVDGILETEKIYFLNDSDQMAPEPSQENYSYSTDLNELTEVISDAQNIFDLSNLFFSPDSEKLEGSKVISYLDETIFVLTWKQPINNIVYTFSEIIIKHPSQFRRFLADGVYGSDKQYLTSQMAQSVNAVVASAGDFYKYRQIGLLVHQGTVEKFNSSILDSCFIDANGDLIFSKAGEINSREALDEFIEHHDIRFSLCFGPILIDNGVSCVPDRYPLGEISKNYSRAAICQLGSLHYLLVTANSEGIYAAYPSLYYFAYTLAELGIEKAYTLDGGQTATIVMNDKVINHVSYGSERYISDIIYFATAIPESE